MSLAKTSASAIATLAIIACLGTSASACEWYQKQVTAKAQTPPASEQTMTSATPIDPVVLAEMRSTESEAAIEK